MKRLFVAIKIEPQQKFQDFYKSISSNCSHFNIKWANLDNIHITLKFFGDTPSVKIPDIIKTLEKSTEYIHPFSMQLTGASIFGSRYEPRIIWIGIEKNEILNLLFENISKKLQEIGYIPDRQNFVPHITIGRIANIKDKKLFQKIMDMYKLEEIQKCTIKEFYLYESILHKEGAEHKALQEFKLPYSAGQDTFSQENN